MNALPALFLHCNLLLYHQPLTLLFSSSVFTITKEGWTHHVSQDMNEIYYGEYLPEKIAEEERRAAANDDSKMQED